MFYEPNLYYLACYQAGTFTVTVVITGVYDKVVQTKTVSITVTETVTETDPVEIICPDVIHPGEYFNCVVDIPTGKIT